MTERFARPTRVAVLLVIVAIAGVGTAAARGGASPRVAAAASWSIVPSPSPFSPSVLPLAGVSCSSATSCFAVGTNSDLNDYPGLPHQEGPSLGKIEQWDGTTWSSLSSPLAVSEPGAEHLHAVSCVSATSCVAVGALGITVYPKTLAERWDGVSWSVVESPEPIDAVSSRLDGVSCSSDTNCLAVGTYTKGSADYTLTEQWDGVSWTIVASPNPSAAVRSNLRTVSCVSETSCIAVGGYVAAGVNKGGALVESWDGASWTLVPTPPPVVRPVDAPVVTSRLDGVSCSSATSCIAVGYTASDALIERWDGTSWTLLGSPVPHIHLGIAALHAVSCASATDCSAVGVALDTSQARKGGAVPNSIAEHWDGSVWTIVARPPGVPVNKSAENGFGQLSNLSGVSCPTATSCVAVGDSALPERWDGSSWSLAPLVPSTSRSYLNHVTCPTATSCFAVGTASSFLDATTITLIEHWDGAGWSVVPSPTPSGLDVQAALTSISCPKPNDCTTVGAYSGLSVLDPNHGFGASLIEHWNGTRWSVVTSPRPPKATFWQLTSVSCPSVTSCNAVGWYDKHLLTEHWNGTRWSVVTVPSPSGAFNLTMSAVSCSSATSCFATGSYQTGSVPSALLERWNGTSWSIVPTPKPAAGTFFQLNAVSCRSATDCTAVGYREASTFLDSTQKSLVMHWNGTRWSTAPTSNPTNARLVNLKGVSCSNATSCTAVGSYNATDLFSPDGLPLLEQWNGTRWSIVAAAIPADALGSALNGVVCLRATGCVAVGARATTDGLHTLVEQRSGP